MEVAKVGSHGSIDSVNPEKEVDNLGSIIRQAIGKEPLISFSRSGDSPVQWMQLRHAMDQTGSGKAYSNSKIDYVIRGKEHPVGICNGLNDEQSKVKESDNFIKDNGAIADGINSTSEQMQIKFPEAFLALAQAAARVNGEPEKYLPGWPLLSSSKAQLQKCKKCSREFCSPINYRRHLRVHRQSLNIKKDSARNREFLGAFWDKLTVDEAKEILSLDDAVIEDVAGSAVIRALSLWIKKQGLSSLPQSYVKAGVTLLDIIQTRTSSLPIPSQELFHVLDEASEKTFLCSGTAVSLQKFVFDGETGKMALEMRNLVACVSFLLEQKLVKAWLADKDAEALRCHKLLMEEEEAAQRRQAEILERKRMKKIRQREQKEKEKDKGNDEVSSCTSENTYGHLEIPDAVSVSDPYSPDSSMSEDHSSLIPCGSYPDGETSHGLRLSSGEAVQETDQQEKQLVNGNPLPVLNHLPPCKQVRAVRNGLYKQTSTTNSVLTKYRNKDNVHMVWTRKAKPENQNQPSHEVDQMDKDRIGRTVNSKVLIGSISVTLTKSDGHCQEAVSPLTISEKEKLLKPETRLKSIEPSLRKQWIPVIRHEDDLRTINSIEKMNDRLDESSAAIASHSPDDNCHFANEVSVNNAEVRKDFLMFPRVTDSSAPFIFSTTMADTFLFQRWKDVISADHVKLDLIPENDGVDICSPLGGNTMVGEPNFELTSSQKFDKSCKLEYVPKQRNV